MKQRQSRERGTSRRQMAIAFIAGMVMTASLAQAPVAADVFSPRPSHESTAPAPPDTVDSPKPGSPDTDPAKYPVSELVYTFNEEAVSSC